MASLLDISASLREFFLKKIEESGKALQSKVLNPFSRPLILFYLYPYTNLIQSEEFIILLPLL